MSAPSAGASLRHCDLYHTGLVVSDIDSAAECLTALTGCTWTTPVEYSLDIETQDGTSSVNGRFRYSLQPPHLELVQEVPGTPWIATPHATHHLGYWTDDLDGAAAQLEESGFTCEMRPVGALASTFAYYVDRSGLRIELVARKYFPDWSEFLAMMTPDSITPGA